MPNNSKTPSNAHLNRIIENLEGQITYTINGLSPLIHKNNYCYQTSDDLVKELLNIIYIPIKYEFFITYTGKDVEYKHNNSLSATMFNPVIPKNTYVSPSDITVISKLSLDIHSNSNTIDSHTHKIIINTADLSEGSSNAYIYMFKLAFGELNKPKLSEHEIRENLTITDELFGPKGPNMKSVDPDKIHGRLPKDHTGFNHVIRDTSQSIWKSAFLYKKFALNVSFTTITVSSNGQNRSISILEPTIRTVDYKTLKIPTVDNTARPKTPDKSNVTNKLNLQPINKARLPPIK
jgi:hypothetical protein